MRDAASTVEGGAAGGPRHLRPPCRNGQTEEVSVLPTRPDSKSLTVADAVTLFIQHDARRAGRCERSAAERDRLLLEFSAAYGTRLVSDCCQADLQFWMDSHDNWRSDWTLLRALRSIRRPFNWLVGLGVIQRSPFAGLSHPPGERGRSMRPEEFQLLLRNSKAVFRRVLIMLRWAGVRPGELRAIEWAFLDLERGLIILQRHKTARSRKDRKPRIIVLHPVVIKLLIWIRRHQPESKFVFLNSRGRPWTRTAIDLRLYRMRRRIGLDKDCKLYSARHAWASQAAKNGVDLKTLAELLGHTTTAMASYYVHVEDVEHLKASVLKAMK